MFGKKDATKGAKMTSPEKFLKSLGISRTTNRDVDRLREKYEKTGILSTDEGEYLSEKKQDQMFVNEEMGRTILGSDWDRLVAHMISIHPGTPGFNKARKVVDLGGGTGLLSIWWATQFPDCQFYVIDQSQKALNLGEEWARRKNLTNVHFIKRSYREIVESSEDFTGDYTVFYYALDMHIEPEPQPEPDIYRNSPPKVAEPFYDNLLEGIKAFKKCISSDGMGILSLPAPYPGTYILFDELRKHGLAVDWDQTRTDAHCLSSLPNPGKIPETVQNAFICVRPNFNHALESAWDDQQCFYAFVRYALDKPVLWAEEVESYSVLFADGKVLADFEVETDDGSIERMRLLEKVGRLYMERLSTEGTRQGVLRSAAERFEFFGYFIEIYQERLEFGGNTRKQYVHPDFKNELNVYREQYEAECGAGEATPPGQAQ